MKGLLNKRIDKVKMALTTRCNLACPYCFVDKNSLDMDWNVAKRSVDTLIQSRGNEKLLSLYGGEPLLVFSLIKKIATYARKEANKHKKELMISVCTNLTLLNDEHTNFFRNHDIKLIFTIAGDGISHDKHRVRNDSMGTFHEVAERVPDVLGKIGSDNAGVSFCIFPDTVGNMEKNFISILGLGIRYLNVEIIRDFMPWYKEHANMFRNEYAKILERLTKSVASGDYIFINPINWEISKSLLSNSRRPHCPFNQNFEVYPDGRVAFSPFLLNSRKYDNFVIADLATSKQMMFSDCKFSEGSGICQSCMSKYFMGYESDQGADGIRNAYLRMSGDTARRILQKAESDASYMDYSERIRKSVCF